MRCRRVLRERLARRVRLRPPFVALCSLRLLGPNNVAFLCNDIGRFWFSDFTGKLDILRSHSGKFLPVALPLLKDITGERSLLAAISILYA